MSKLLVNKIKNELNKIKTRYEQKYGAAIFEVEAKISKNGRLILEGGVLSEIQKIQAENAVKKSGINRIKNSLKVLCDPKEKAEIGWGIVKPDIADMFSVFPGRRREKFRSDKPLHLTSVTPKAQNSKTLIRWEGKFRAAQLEKNDIVRILAKKKDYLLTQKNDLTIGWIKKSQMSKLPPSLMLRRASKTQNSKRGWRNVKRAKPDKALKIRSAKSVRKRFIAFLKKYLAVPYLRGGTTNSGLDCSGLAQKFYGEIFGILLPKHSTDQALCGKIATLKNARFGDLIFFRRKKKKFPHIGIVAEAVNYSESAAVHFKKVWILNARQEQGKTAIEDLSEILKTYKLISVKKIL